MNVIKKLVAALLSDDTPAAKLIVYTAVAILTGLLGFLTYEALIFFGVITALGTLNSIRRVA